MLDFTINLLIFFIIVTAFIKAPGVTVVKPDASTAVQHASATLQIGITADDEIWMAGHQVDLRRLATLVERQHIQRPKSSVVILADKGSSAGMLAKVMDKVRQAGVTDIAIGANPSGKG
ncbi:MAG: biopolymer transporter ExbD [Gammaproteobacteria bacterium]|nr:biopolymer transporter ExbD [Gammaproteobacteria bacterium]